MATIVQTPTFLTLLGGGPVEAEHLAECLHLAPVLVAADGGADHALAAGHMPDAVIGDMDSISAAARKKIAADRLHYIAEQDSTDFAKCLMRIDASLILAEGFAGGRLDHQLAACTTLVNFPDRPVLLLSPEDVCFLAPLDLELVLEEGTRVSLYPMAPVQGRSEGLLYPIDGLTLAPNTRVGTSNAATGPVRLSFEGRHMLVILPRSELAGVIAALSPGD